MAVPVCWELAGLPALSRRFARTAGSPAGVISSILPRSHGRGGFTHAPFRWPERLEWVSDFPRSKVNKVNKVDKKLLRQRAAGLVAAG